MKLRHWPTTILALFLVYGFISNAKSDTIKTSDSEVRLPENTNLRSGKWQCIDDGLLNSDNKKLACENYGGIFTNGSATIYEGCGGQCSCCQEKGKVFRRSKRSTKKRRNKKNGNKRNNKMKKSKRGSQKRHIKKKKNSGGRSKRRHIKKKKNSGGRSKRRHIKKKKNSGGSKRRHIKKRKNSGGRSKRRHIKKKKNSGGRSKRRHIKKKKNSGGRSKRRHIKKKKNSGGRSKRRHIKKRKNSGGRSKRRHIKKKKNSGGRSRGGRSSRERKKGCGGKCHAFARCRRKRCVCKKGFTGNGFFCAKGPTVQRCKGKCPKNSQCKRGKCVCKRGYKKSGKTCVRPTVKRCKEKCPKNSKCKRGKCVCKRGYKKSGKTCARPTVKRCKGKCQKNSKCKRGKCVCKRGYKKSGKACVRPTVKRCKGKCPKNSKCKRGKCVCKRGYKKSGKTCVRPTVKRCKGKCPKNSKCKRGKCVCKRGYKKSGKTCITAPVKQCRRKCGKNAICSNGKCVCKNGFRGNGRKCFKKPSIGNDITVCEDKKETIQCKQNSIIKIIKATYGRADRTTCKHQHMSNIKCTTTKPLAMLRKKCDGKNTCVVESSNGLYGDPCPGTYKYISLMYTCQGPTVKRCKRKCPNNSKCKRGKCVCKRGYKKSGKTCVRPTVKRCKGKCPKNSKCKRGNCVCKKGYKKSGKTCITAPVKQCRRKCGKNAICSNGKCVCKNGFRGNGRKCFKKPSIGNDITVCEDKKETIQCKQNSIIKIIKATYGRADRTTCKHQHMSNIKCTTTKPLAMLRKKCDGKNTCVVESSNGLYGDPCPGTYKYISLMYTCQAGGPLCGKSLCNKNAYCRNGRCVCKNGFTGDGVLSCVGSCTCSAAGDPHYRTFDGQLIHFMGICTYSMVKTTTTDDCGGFEVRVKNEHRGRNTKVSFTKYVLIVLKGSTIKLGKGNTVLVNDIKVSTPYLGSSFEIRRSGGKVRVETDCGLRVTWDGNAAVTVTVPKSYSGKVNGLCGDCNGKKDDFKTREGLDVSQKKNKYALIGKSYTANNENEPNKNCVVEDVSDPCTPDKRPIAVKACSLLDPSFNKSPFIGCAGKDKDGMADMYQSCLFDVCSNIGDPNYQSIICNIHEGAAEQCEDLGFSVKWRSKDFCPFNCPSNMEYSASVSGCPANCVDPDAPATCISPTTEGCACKDGYLLSGNECVKKEQCGCVGPDQQYYPIGTVITSPDCAIVTECKVINGSPDLVLIKTQSCHKNAKCRISNGGYACKCKKFFRGDGVNSCEQNCPMMKCFKKCPNGFKKNRNGCPTCKCKPKISCKRKCGQNERCRRGKCVCKRGLIRSLNGKCEILIIQFLKDCLREAKICIRNDIRPGVRAALEKKYGCNPKCDSNQSCRKEKCIQKVSDCTPKCGPNQRCRKGKCINKVPCKRKCGPNERCTRGKCVCKRGLRRSRNGKCQTKVPCKRKCGPNERCRRGKCICKRGLKRSLIGKCQKKVSSCTPKCGPNQRCKKGKCITKVPCKRKCGPNERCVRGKCVCKRGLRRLPNGKCQKKVPCKRKCGPNERCRRRKCVCKRGFRRLPNGKCQKKVSNCTPKCGPKQRCRKGKCITKVPCKRKCGPNERCRRRKCVCKRGFRRLPNGKCQKKVSSCTPKCGPNQRCRKGKCITKVPCKRKCGPNERCVRGKCVCKRGLRRLPNGKCQKEVTGCNPKCGPNQRCRKGKCIKKVPCKRKCGPNERCRRRKCVCKRGFRRLPNGKCQKKVSSCTPKCGPKQRCRKGKCITKVPCKRKCGPNERCRRRKCVCKRGFRRLPNGKCQKKVSSCTPKCGPNQRCRKGKCITKVPCKRKCGPNERCVRGKCVCKRGLRRLPNGKCQKEVTGCNPKCGPNQRCRKGKCIKKVPCKRKCGPNERCRRRKCVCKRGFRRLPNGKCQKKVSSCTPKCGPNQRCRKGKCIKKVQCKRKCGPNERCRRRKCVCKRGFRRLPNGKCQKKVSSCTPKCGPKQRCRKGKCITKVPCKRKCGPNERCVRGKCVCKRGLRRLPNGKCQKEVTGCNPKCGPNQRCRKGKCITKVPCKRKCGPNERCVRGKCVCKRGLRRLPNGKCQKEVIGCNPKCGPNQRCRKGKCIKKVQCKRKCGPNERCRRRKCVCKRGFRRLPNGKCQKKVSSCTPKCGPNQRCKKGKCITKVPCKRKCGPNERCVRGKCVCKRGLRRLPNGKCQKEVTGCNPKCGPNQRCRKGKCITVVSCKSKCGANERCRRGKCVCKRGHKRSLSGECESLIGVSECLDPSDRKGVYYKGTVSTTVSGRTCQPWKNQFPHKHRFSGLKNDHNYCRNPDNEPWPWCYTADKHVRFEPCRIPVCDLSPPPCTTFVEITCHSPHQARTQCTVHEADRVDYVTIADHKASSSCKFGENYGFFENKIWTKKGCAEKLKICFKKKHGNPILPPLSECRTSQKGEDYKGEWSLTDSGKKCQRWDSQYPHSHSFILEADGAENFCRNFDGSERPWCYTEDPLTEREYCPIPLCEEPSDSTDNECTQTAKGHDYRGRISVTVSGRTCQNWEMQYPHKHGFGRLKTERNYCRNPDGEAHPWCYTNDPKKRWEFCEVPMCSQCSISDEVDGCKSKIKISGTCFYKSKQQSECSYSIQMTTNTDGPSAYIKTATQEMTLTNGGTFKDCATFTFADDSLTVEETICKCDDQV